MRTLFLDCGMGAAGDMLNGALLELLEDPDGFVRAMNDLGLPQVSYQAGHTEKCGIVGTKITVLVDGDEEHSIDWHEQHDHGGQPQHPDVQIHHHDAEIDRNIDDHVHHRHAHRQRIHHHHDHADQFVGHHHHSHPHASMTQIVELIDSLALPDQVKADAIAIYRRIADAESKSHDIPVDQIHFHEVGTMDAVADVVGACWLMYLIDPDQVVVSPIRTGYGYVKCAHGMLPIPAPATALILKQIPVYAGGIEGEMCTPTGAAILAHFADHFAQMPAMAIDTIGYGMGSKDFPAANCVRAVLGQAVDHTQPSDDEPHGDIVFELVCNIDDMTAEQVAFAQERLYQVGAIEVYTTALTMKKGRPGILLTCLVDQQRRKEVVRALFTYTSTIGIRESLYRRYVLDRREITVNTEFGQVRAKISQGWGVRRVKCEYDDLARIARTSGITLDEVRRVAHEAIDQMGECE